MMTVAGRALFWVLVSQSFRLPLREGYLGSHHVQYNISNLVIQELEEHAISIVQNTTMSHLDVSWKLASAMNRQ
ncbi:hypothetical protein BGZ61DRAFT_444445 [Ilyonectria robusta]|uniref:uncharacterized protein n=1 Tax=Ilyonectria robusta TaxID=1079257 RepID=UPI001E8D8330|nr:uncharacterized protein BGZ61DRAFT_444445 [Ilyonectria robusta]KAH8733392.1 hypothetical protein BGZ61DRAFT_444445 [Ilyonectria robusta]